MFRKVRKSGRICCRLVGIVKPRRHAGFFWKAAVVSTLVGALILVCVAIVGSYQTSFSIFLLIVTSSYAVAGLILAAVWPRSAWIIGLFLFGVWPPILILMFVFSDKPRSSGSLRNELTDLFAYLAVLPASCVGAWVGASIRKRVEGRIDNPSEERSE
jgi:hypothetical protein